EELAARAHLAGAGRDLLGGHGDFGERFVELAERFVQRLLDARVFASVFAAHAGAQVARGYAVEHFGRFVDGRDDGVQRLVEAGDEVVERPAIAGRVAARGELALLGGVDKRAHLSR